jgi:hypothetical protein
VPFAIRIGFVLAVVLSFGSGIPCILVLLGIINTDWPLVQRLVICITTLIVILVFGASGYGLYVRISWSRSLALAFWPAAGITGIVQRYYLAEQPFIEGIGIAVEIIISTVMAYWYLYRKESVRSYFNAVEST